MSEENKQYSMQRNDWGRSRTNYSIEDSSPNYTYNYEINEQTSRNQQTREIDQDEFSYSTHNGASIFGWLKAVGYEIYNWLTRTPETELSALQSPINILSNQESNQAGNNGINTRNQYAKEIDFSDRGIQLGAEVLWKVEGFVEKLYFWQRNEPTIGFGFMTKGAYTRAGLKKLGYTDEELSTREKIENILKVLQYC